MELKYSILLNKKQVLNYQFLMLIFILIFFIMLTGRENSDLFFFSNLIGKNGCFMPVILNKIKHKEVQHGNIFLQNIAFTYIFKWM